MTGYVLTGFLAFLSFLLGAIEELTKGDWGIFTPLAFVLVGLCFLTLAALPVDFLGRYRNRP